MQSFRDTGGKAWSYDESARIGDGSGMGQVFRGRGGGEAVAVKRVQPYDFSDSAERRRQREAEIGERLMRAAASGLPTDRLVVPLGHAFSGDDLLIVMPLADESLLARMRGTRFGPPAAVRVVREVVEGLIQLAAFPLLHRDLKPANVLRYGEHWRLADFGLARDLAERTGTYTFRGAGTYPWMAPEIWEFQPATVRSDLYALGVLAYQVCTGELPFRGPGEDDFRRQHLTAVPPTPDGLPPRLQRLLLRLLSKDLAERPENARAVAETLDGLARRLPAEAEGLAEAALGMQERTARAEAGRVVRSMADRQAGDLVKQGRADLRELLADAYDDVRLAAGDARLDDDRLALLVGPVEVLFDVRSPVALSRFDDGFDEGHARTILVGSVRPVGTLVSYAPGPDGRLRWSYAESVVSPDRHPLTVEAVIAIVRAAIEAHGISRRPGPP